MPPDLRPNHAFGPSPEIDSGRMGDLSSSEPLPILFRDPWMVVVNKPAGQMVHPADNPSEGDQVTMKILRDQIGCPVFPIHRLDRPTTGALVFATDQAIAQSLHERFRSHLVTKVYWAVVEGHPKGDAWTCDEPIRKEPHSPSQAAHTDFRVLARLDESLALIEAIPKTGRHHQIRRHLLHAGHPIVGDYRYAGIERSDAWGERLGSGTRMFLHARSLRFAHPIHGEE
ncbi:MAG: RluA family pseudouridine synthase, partial [Verrucomicrobiae bacterium]|nr:RluA family pseudouridine synthase [Verrucomicrobiae bacterium]